LHATDLRNVKSADARERSHPEQGVGLGREIWGVVGHVEGQQQGPLQLTTISGDLTVLYVVESALN